jgi:very-short-patch-repair endonuclease
MGIDAAPHPVAALACLDELQHGAFTTQQALTAGWSEVAVAAARRTKAWHKLFRGVYVDAIVWAALSARGKHLCLAHGRTLALGQGWHAARRSAATALGLPLLGTLPQEAQLLRDPRGAASNAVSRHERLATLPDAHTCVVGGLAVTSKDRTAIDIARDGSFRSAVVVADAALRAGTTQAELLATARFCAAWRNGVAGMRVAEFANGLSESPLESISRVAFRELDLPEPELQIQVIVDEELIARLDFFWRATHTIGQADGAEKYDGKQRVLADKLQDERLEDLGFEVVRWPWSAAWNPRGVLDEKVRRGMARGARQDLDPRVRLVPTTVADNVRTNARRRAA